MEISEIEVDGYEKVVRCRDEASGLHAIIAVHDTTLGPALGGMRMLPYVSEDEALFDVLRLSRGMTYKSAVAETGLGGGKSVVIGDPAKLKSQGLFHAMGRFIDSLEGRYITAEDMNIGIRDLELVRESTRWVTGLSRESGSSGNPSPYTARGCLQGMRAVLEESAARPTSAAAASDPGRRRRGRRAGRAAQAARRARHHLRHQPSAVQELRAQHGFESCADEGTLASRATSIARARAARRSTTRPSRSCAARPCRLRQQPAARAAHAEALQARGILYAPDYVINAGGIINVGMELRQAATTREGHGAHRSHLRTAEAGLRDRAHERREHARGGRTAGRVAAEARTPGARARRSSTELSYSLRRKSTRSASSSRSP
jgi:leucine dehydrogenase